MSDVFAALRAAIQDEVRKVQRAEIVGSAVYVSQRGSALGPRRHCAIVRQRMRELPPEECGAARVGKMYYLTLEAYHQEMQGRGIQPPAKAASVAEDDEEQAGYERARALIAGAR